MGRDVVLGTFFSRSTSIPVLDWLSVPASPGYQMGALVQCLVDLVAMDHVSASRCHLLSSPVGAAL